jgi:hypothetical protein
MKFKSKGNFNWRLRVMGTLHGLTEMGTLHEE